MAQDRGRVGGELLTFEIETVDLGKFHQIAEPKRAAGLDHILEFHFQIRDQQLESIVCDIVIDSQLDDATKTAHPDTLLHGLQQVAGFDLLDLHIIITNDAERMNVQDLHPREEIAEVGGDDLFHPNKVVVEGDGAILPDTA